MASIFDKLKDSFLRVRGGGIEVSNRRYERVADAVLKLADSVAALSDELLKSRCAELAKRIRETKHDRNVAEYFAYVREVARRTIGLKMYAVQVVAGVALVHGKMVEMQTGEGKTLVAVAPACLHALAGRGVHVLTFNEYLAQRDADWMGPVYKRMGLIVACVTADMTLSERRDGYAADVTYVTAKQLGFDFLKDQLATHVDDQVLRGFHFAILDEADSTLIDEARTPLVIAGEDHEEENDFFRYAEITRDLTAETHYCVQQGMRDVNYSAAGIEEVQRIIGCGDLYTESNVDVLTRLNLALQAETLLKRDVDYLVRDNAIELIDEFTGRVAENRRWPYGLQAALEAKENVSIQPQGRILKSVTLRHLFESYQRLSGMTGTARRSAVEIHDFYSLKTVIVPPNKPCIRIDQPDLVFANKDGKHAAIVEEIRSVHASGRPVLVGTSSVKESERLASLLVQNNVNCRVLNAKHDATEAEIIADAGSLYAVTISTNMAGRGTDIVLGGHRGGDREQIVALGGLYVIGTNRHDSRRIDEQLRGRAGRQGDPGESRFFVSAQDDLLLRCGVAVLEMDVSQFDDSKPISDPKVGQRIAQIQRFIESEILEIRRTLRMYTDCLERQRRMMHEQRQNILDRTPDHSLLKAADVELFQQQIAQYGESIVQEAESVLAIFHIDDCWADHLRLCSELRQNVHLASLGGLNAYDEFNKQLSIAFRKFSQRVAQNVADSFRDAHASGYGLDALQRGLVKPSSTWTYMINDNPMGDVFDRISKSIKRMSRRSSR